MNNTKRSIGVTLFAIIGFLVSGVQSLVVSILFIYTSINYMKNGASAVTGEFGAITSQILFINIIMFFVAIGLIISAIYLFRLKDLARKLFLWLNTILFFLSNALVVSSRLPRLLTSLIYCLVFIYFFTRPKVKEQFR